MLLVDLHNIVSAGDILLIFILLTLLAVPTLIAVAIVFYIERRCKTPTATTNIRETVVRHSLLSSLFPYSKPKH